MAIAEHECAVEQSWIAKDWPSPAEWREEPTDKSPSARFTAWSARHDSLFSSARDWNANTHKNQGHAGRLVSLSASEELQETASYHIEKWKKATASLSSVSKMISHPSYLRLIALGAKSDQVLRLILEELRAEPDYWFTALEAISGENPVVESESDFDAAVETWVRWGKSNFLLT